MLLQLDNIDKEKVSELLDFAKSKHIGLRLLDNYKNDYFLPGPRLSDEEITAHILKAREGKRIPMEVAHQQIIKSLNGD